MRVSITLCVFCALMAVTIGRPMGGGPRGRGPMGGGPGFKGPKFNSSQLFDCTGTCTPETFKNCTGTCNAQVTGFNKTLPAGFNSTQFPRPDRLPQLSGCTGNCTTENFPMCTGACIATLNSTVHLEGRPGKFNGTHPEGGKFNVTRPVLSACTGNCTEILFPKCVGTCTATSNLTNPGLTVPRPVWPGISGCTGGCNTTTFPLCVGSCVLTANNTRTKPGPGGHHGGHGHHRLSY